MQPRVSIVIPSFNSGDTLERAIESLVAQNYPNLQLILIDGESTDHSRLIIERHRGRFDRVVIEPDSGQANALNKGFALADGEIFGWLCADDELLPGAIAEIARVFGGADSPDVATGDCERVYPDHSIARSPADARAWEIISLKNVIEQSATFWRSDLHRRVGPIDESYSLCFDWDLWNRFARAGAKLATTPALLSRYHFSLDNKTSVAGRRFVEEASRIIAQYEPHGERVANAYGQLYRHFDLKGCYDKPRIFTLFRAIVLVAFLAQLRVRFGKRVSRAYNWHFASCQERGLRWW